jgi:hypothetical protein
MRSRPHEAVARDGDSLVFEADQPAFAPIGRRYAEVKDAHLDPMHRLLATLALASIALALTGSQPSTDVTTVTPAAKVATEPVPSGGDAADDPAIWVHPDDPARSLVLGTDKKGGLHAYSLDGRQRQLVSPGSRPKTSTSSTDSRWPADDGTWPSPASARGGNRRG